MIDVRRAFAIFATLIFVFNGGEVAGTNDQTNCIFCKHNGVSWKTHEPGVVGDDSGTYSNDISTPQL
jgi:hypothetical protein